MNIDQHRTREARQITTVIALVCAVGFAAAVVPAVEHTITVILLIAAGLAVIALAGRVVARRVRERREDRADERTAAVLRAEYQARRAADIVKGRA